MKQIILTTFFAMLSMATFATTYYAKPNGNGDGLSYDNAGEFTSLITKLQAGDILYCLGGQYDYTTNIKIKNSGTADNMICIFAYPNETPIFDFRKQAYGSRGISPAGNYIHIKGLTIRYTGKNGLYNTGSYNIFEMLDVYGNGDTGVQMKEGHNNLILNCDSHDNFDYKLGDINAADFGGNADGFADKQYTGGGNTYRGCRAWNNSDDGWDFYSHVTGTYGQTVIDSCICYNNGPGEYDMRNHARYETDKSWFDKFQSEITVKDKRSTTHKCSLEHYINMGNANGFKLGGNYTVHNVTLTNSLAVYNGNTFNLPDGLGAKGIDQNNNAGTMHVYNCTSYLNAINIGFDNSTRGTLYLYNNISYKGEKSDVIKTPVIYQECNSWNIKGLTITDNDFLSVDTTGIISPRNEDGSLPYLDLMHLSKQSQLIDKGTTATQLPYCGNAPDLGCYEYTSGHDTSGLQNTIDTNGSIVSYNLLGIQTDNAKHGIFIVKTRDKVIKVAR